MAVLVVDSSGGAVRTLAEQAPRSGTTVAVGMDRAMQSAAEDAVEPVVQQAMLVAVSVSTGDVLAVAQNPAADAEGPLALTGRYPPGSTFKVATATAAMAEDGLTVDTQVPCPATTVIGGRVVPNAGRFDLGTVPLRTAFARSCNTTFAQLATQLDPGALPAAALRLGLGADYTVPGIVTITGSVPASAEEVLRAENGFGQGQVLASPFGVALAAAVVARGGPVVPQLIRDRPTQVLVPATAPDPAALEALRSMMRAVVTEGTASALAGMGRSTAKPAPRSSPATAGHTAGSWGTGATSPLPCWSSTAHRQCPRCRSRSASCPRSADGSVSLTEVLPRRLRWTACRPGGYPRSRSWPTSLPSWCSPPSAG